MYEQCTTITDIVNEIFMDGLRVSEMMTDREGGTKHGLYLRNKSIPKEQVKDLPQLQRLFVNARKKCILLSGDTNNSDIENTQAEIWSYICECMLGIFRGEMNDKVGTLLQCDGTVEGCKELLNDNIRVIQLCKYTLEYIERKMRRLSQLPSNPDSSYDRTTDKYKDIKYLYLDEETEGHFNRYELLDMQDLSEPCNSDVTEYIIDNFIFGGHLSSKQELFCKTVIEFGINDDGNIYDLYNNLLYRKQDCTKYRNRIEKKLTKFIDDDDLLVILDNRIQFRRE